MKKFALKGLQLWEGARMLTDKVKTNRGYQNDITGALICPINVRWMEDDEYVINLF